MLVFSLPYLLFSRITSCHWWISSIHLPILFLHIPFKLGLLTNCILIYNWFYNQFYYHLFTISSMSSSACTSIKKTSSRSRQFHPLSLHHLSFFIYIFVNFTMVYSFHTNDLPLMYLGILSSLFVGASFIYWWSSTNFLHSFVPSSTILPSINKFSSNRQKLCSLTAWQSMSSSTSHLMIFFDERAICINTGASCWISNSKEDFFTFAPSSSSVLQGIGSGLSIAGSGTIKWCILNDIGDQVDLHLHNSLYVPRAPMCLLSPQHMAQQIALLSDGFHSKGHFGT